jgi:hypothetical protein
MALTKQTRKPFWHLLAGLAGLIGLAAIGVGLLVLYFIDGRVGMYIFAGGGALVVPAVLWLIVGGVHLVGSRRGAVGINVAVQVALATALLVGVNMFSFTHHKRWDLTWDEIFTIEPKLRDQFAQMRGETTIVMHLRHASFGQGKEHKRDAYDAAAERKVLQKARDLIEQFQELGPRFKVEVLDAEQEGYKSRLEALTKNSPQLRAAIDRSIEDAIFFASGDKVQSLNFTQVFQLDRPASLAANNRKGNLVLRPQGIEPFARRILNIEEKRPRVAVGVIHALLSMGSDDPAYTLRGVKKVLVAQGWEGRDLILKKFEDQGPEPAALTYDDYRYEQLEDDLADDDARIKLQQEILQETREDVAAEKKAWMKATLKDLNRQLAALDLGDDRLALIKRSAKRIWEEDGYKVVDLTETHRDKYLQSLDAEVTRAEARLKALREERAGRARELATLNTENLREQQRITDVQAKLKRLLADCDLLIVSRWTLFNLPRRDFIIPWLHGLDNEQTEAVKAFLKAGKPVLFCLGPANEPPDPRFRRPPEVKADGIEPLLADLGFKLPVQTVLYDVQSQTASERRLAFLNRQSEVVLPPVAFDWPVGTGSRPGGQARGSSAKEAASGPPHPIRASLRLTAGEKSEDPELRLRYPRPVYHDAPAGSKTRFDPVFMMSGPDSWNESQPFPSEKRTPRFEGAKSGDPKRGKEEGQQRGPLPIAAAAEVPLPLTWYADARLGASTAALLAAPLGEGSLLAASAMFARARDLPTVRIAVIGQGGVF